MASYVDEDGSVPTVDMAPFVDWAAHDDAARAAAAGAWDRAMSEVGFAFIVGHGVSEEVVGAMRRGALSFFAQDAAAKAAYSYGAYGNPLGGYTGVGTEAVARSRDGHGSDSGGGAALKAAPPDLVESFIFKPREMTRPKPASLDAPGRVYHAALLGVLESLHKLTAAALGLPSTFFDPFYDPSPEVSLRLAYCPPVPDADRASSAVRYGEHTDYTGFTILKQDDGDVGDMNAGGLQVRLKDGRWTAVKPRAGAFVVNIGDLYEVWTNGRWRSTVHRVMKPPPDSPAASAPRLSIPFFTGPHNDAIIAAMPTCVDEDHPPKYAPVRALDHLLSKLQASNT